MLVGGNGGGGGGYGGVCGWEAVAIGDEVSRGKGTLREWEKWNEV